MASAEFNQVRDYLVSKGFETMEAEVAARIFSYATVVEMGVEELQALRIKAKQMLDRASLQEVAAGPTKEYLKGQGLSDEEIDTLLAGDFSLETLKNLTKDRLQQLAEKYKGRVKEELAKQAAKYGVDQSALKYGGAAYKLAVAEKKFAESMDALAATTYPNWSPDSGFDPALERFNSVMDERAAISEERRAEQDKAIRELFGEVAALGVFGGPVGWVAGLAIYGFGEFSIWTKNRFMEDLNKREYVDSVKANAAALFGEFGLLPPDSGLYLNTKNYMVSIEKTLANYRGTVGRVPSSVRWIPPPMLNHSFLFSNSNWNEKWMDVIAWAANGGDPVITDLFAVGLFPFSYLEIQGSDPYIPCIEGGYYYGGVYKPSCFTQRFEPGSEVTYYTPIYDTETITGFRYALDGAGIGTIRIRSFKTAVMKMEDAALAIGTVVARRYGRDHGPIAEATLRALRMSLVRHKISKADIDLAEKNIIFVKSLKMVSDADKNRYVDWQHQRLNDWRDGKDLGKIVDVIPADPLRLRFLVSVALHEVGELQAVTDGMEIKSSGFGLTDRVTLSVSAKLPG